MSEVLVVRHAQATFAGANYDMLSPLGHRQAGLLGDYLASTHAPFAAVACGGMRRHRETLDAIEQAVARQGGERVEARCITALDEFDHRDVLAVYSRRHPADPIVLAADAGGSHDPRTIYHFLRAALGAWASGELDDAVTEPWHAFKQRVRAAGVELATLAQEHERTLVVTSGGVMAQLAAAALEVPDSRAIELNLAIRNSALSEFRVLDGALRVASWNTLPHLAAPERRGMWTYF